MNFIVSLVFYCDEFDTPPRPVATLPLRWEGSFFHPDGGNPPHKMGGEFFPTPTMAIPTQDGRGVVRMGSRNLQPPCLRRLMGFRS